MNTQNGQSFYGMGIAPRILETLEGLKFKVPTPIQQKAIPVAIEGKDIIGVAQTGTGKTMAFGIPMVQRLAITQGKGLVLVPTRELALQVDEAIRKIAGPMKMRTAVLIGGASMNNQVRDIRRNPNIVIATPGRLNDHLGRGNIRLNAVQVLILDEADRMLDMGFLPQIEEVLKHVPAEKQVLLFSATIPEKIVSIATRYMKLPVSVEIAKSGTVADKVTQELYIIRKEEKSKLLEKLLYQYKGTVLLFSRTKRGAARITKELKFLGHNAAEIHSDLSLSQRREALDGFKSGKYRILVATDIAARGIDVDCIEVVINYDLPDDSENYIHRIGRTGRAKHEGRAISFATPDQRGEVESIEKVMRTALPIVQHPEVPSGTFYTPPRSSKPFASHRSHFRSRTSRRPRGR